MKMVVTTRYGYYTNELGEAIMRYKKPKGVYELPAGVAGYAEVPTYDDMVNVETLKDKLPKPKTAKEILLDLLKDEDIKEEIKKIKV